jgi:hypothetical protein
MSCFRVFAAVWLVLIGGALMLGKDVQGEQKDPPRQMEGTVKKVDDKGPEATYLIITVKEKEPTAEEDMFREVDRDYRFRVTPSTRVIGVDGKPDPQALKSLQTHPWVRLEYRKDLALEVKKLPPR